MTDTSRAPEPTPAAALPAANAMRLADFWSQKFATPNQYFLTEYFSQRVGAVLAYGAYRAGLTPNAVTLAGLVVMLAASACLAGASARPGLGLAALLLYQLGFGLDCADGQLARGTHRASVYGGWLDNACDHVRYHAIVLALGANLVLGSDLPLALSGAALFILGCGQSVSLHTTSTLKGGSYRPHGLTGAADVAKWLVRTLSDTPFFLLLICLLLPYPWLLAAYISFIGMLNLSQSIALALLRMK